MSALRCPRAAARLCARAVLGGPARVRAGVGAVRAASAARGHAAGGGGTRESALSAALRQIESQFGKGAVMQLGARAGPLNVDVIGTGSLALDHALGIGGLPRGRVVEIYGPESSGKTTLALHVVASAQAAGLSACFIDAEHALDPGYARAVGVDLDALYLAQPDTGEQALEIADTLVRSGAMDVLVIDSVAALVPKAELEGEMGDHHMALQARLMSQALRKLTASLSRTGTLIIFLNQIRSKVGVIFGSPDVTPGGNALKFYASVRLEIRRAAPVKRGEDIVGSLTRVKVAKNKLAPPFRVAEFEMTFGSGVNRAAEAVDLGAAFGVLRKSGAWYSVADAELLAAVNAALAGDEVAPTAAAAVAAASSPPPPDAAAAAAAAAAAPRKAKRAKAGAAPIAAVAAAAAPPPAPAAAPTAAPAGSGSAAPALGLDEPFLQGKERVKAFLDAHPAVLAVALRRVRQAMKDRPATGDLVVGGATAAAAVAARTAAAALPGVSGLGIGGVPGVAVGALGDDSADDSDDGTLVVVDDVSDVRVGDAADDDDAAASAHASGSGARRTVLGGGGLGGSV